MALAQWPRDVDIVIVGNGPSALILSFILHGNIPYYNFAHPHPDPILHQKLQASPCLLDIDVNELTAHFAASRISYSTQALPANVLLDTLLRPLADTDPGGYESCVEWRHEPQKSVQHLVFGNTVSAGGQWADNPVTASSDIGALSYTEMLSLPRYSLPEHIREYDGMISEEFDRPSRRVVAEYLQTYPKKVGIEDSIHNNTHVEGISRSTGGFYIKSHNIRCKQLVLASGTFSELIPARPLLQPLLSMPSSFSLNEFPRLVVGSGFTAADVILSTPVDRKILHIFKWMPDEHPSPLRACHPRAYPEYASIYKHMKIAAKKHLSPSEVQSPTPLKDDPITSYQISRYEGLPNTYIKDVSVHGESATITLEGSDGQIFEREISHMQYVIGRRGSLGYLSEDLLSELLPDGKALRMTPIDGKILRAVAQENFEVASNLFVIGSLTGDSLIRFAFGGCVYAAREIMQRQSRAFDGCSTAANGSLAAKDMCNGFLHSKDTELKKDADSVTVCEIASQESEVQEESHFYDCGYVESEKSQDPQSPDEQVGTMRDALKHPRQRHMNCVML